LGLRERLRLVFGIISLALVLLVSVELWIGVREGQQLHAIENRLVPKLELGPRVYSEFVELRRALQEAVAAEDGEALEDARLFRDRLLETLRNAKGVLSPGDEEELRRAAQDYFRTAHSLSRRMIAGETGEALVGELSQMQTKQLTLSRLIETKTRLKQDEMRAAFEGAHRARRTGQRVNLAISVGCLVLVLGLSVGINRELLRSLTDFSEGLARFAKGDFVRPIVSSSRGELAELAQRANEMAQSLQNLANQRAHQDFVKGGLARLSHDLRGELFPDQAAGRAVRALAKYLNAPAGAIYYRGEDVELRLLGSYSLGPADASGGGAVPTFRPGEGLVGQVALDEETRVVEPVPADYARIRSGLGEALPHSVVLVPLVREGRVTAVLELMLLEPCTPRIRELLDGARDMLSVTLEAARSRSALGVLLQETRAQANRLSAQEEELRENNQELLAQQEELRLANEELQAQRAMLAQRNSELEDAHQSMKRKNEELATVSAYKSQFLANMSHELRTPLNSMLLLSHLLSENSGGNLTDRQVEFCKTIHGAGSDLLRLINQVLDLAKIESGRQEMEGESARVAEFGEHARRIFSPLAADRGLTFDVEIAPDVPEEIWTDRRRVEQVLVNLLGNAVKFTERGGIKLAIHRPKADIVPERRDLERDRVIAFSVSDTGIGIAPENRDRVFAPFEQVKPLQPNRHGGTGLGLSIARELATLLGGELRLWSAVDKGSTFTLFLPERTAPSLEPGEAVVEAATTSFVDDDRATIVPGEPHLLAVEDDPVFAALIVELARSQDLKILIAPNAQEGLRVARYYRPRGILLDVGLPDLDGFTVMERLRGDPDTRSIPVHFVSGVDKPERALALGAIGYVTKPVAAEELLSVIRRLSLSSPERTINVLVVEDDTAGGQSLLELLRRERLEARHVTSAGEALSALRAERFDCMILDLGLPDMDGLSVLERLEEPDVVHAPAVVVYTGRALTKEEALRLEAYAEAVIFKDGKSKERLLEEIRLFVRHLRDGIGPKKVPSRPFLASSIRLDGKRVLLADDDMRTVYALSALLRSKGVDVLVADTGKAAVDLLMEDPHVDAVLMDVMMPEMDGYEAIRRIRRDPRFMGLPVIALTAKAMKGERERCMAEGASDYLPKPVDSERLLTALSNWLGPEHATAGS